MVLLAQHRCLFGVPVDIFPLHVLKSNPSALKALNLISPIPVKARRTWDIHRTLLSTRAYSTMATDEQVSLVHSHSVHIGWHHFLPELC